MEIGTARLDEPRFDLGADGLFLDPHPLLAEMRNKSPVYFSPELDSWVLTRHDDICRALMDPGLAVMEETKRIDELPREAQAEFDALRTIFQTWGSRCDAPAHARFIAVLKRQFTPQLIRALEPRIQELMDGFLDQGLRRGNLDIVNDVAHPLAMTVVCELTGIPVEKIGLLLDWSADIAGLLEAGELNQLRACQRAMLEIRDYLQPTLVEHRARRHNDLIGTMIDAQGEGLDYDDDEIIAQCIMFIVVGYHTTANMLCNGLQLLFDHPTERNKLLQNPSLISNAFDEMMRFHGPVSSIRRMSKYDFEVRGKTIKAGDTIVLALSAGNRDPSVFPDPDRFDVSRPEAGQQIGFTVGPYSCMGRALARLEGKVFFSTILGRFPEIVPVDESPDWVAFRPLGRELKTLRVDVRS